MHRLSYVHVIVRQWGLLKELTQTDVWSTILIIIIMIYDLPDYYDL